MNDYPNCLDPLLLVVGLPAELVVVELVVLPVVVVVVVLVLIGIVVVVAVGVVLAATQMFSYHSPMTPF